MNISAILPVAPPRTDSIAPSGASGSSDFQNVLSSAISQVEGSRTEAATSVKQFLSGEGADLHSTILATQRAELEFEMFMGVRNKVVQAYQEIM